MKVKVLGIMDVNMKDEKGNPIDGLSLHCCDAEPVTDNNFTGRHVAKVFVPRRIVGDLHLMIEQVLELEYSQTLGSKNARLSGIRVLSK